MYTSFHHRSHGFTLIELMVVLSIISFLASVLYSVTGTARASAQDTATVAQTNEYQKSFALAMDVAGQLPDPGSTSTYYCVGTSECTFWDNTYTSSPAISGVMGNYTSATNGTTRIIDDKEYSGIVFKCKTANGSTCTEGAVYWAEHRRCSMGKVVLTGANGRVVCGQDAGSTSTNNVETANTAVSLPPGSAVTLSQVWRHPGAAIRTIYAKNFSECVKLVPAAYPSASPYTLDEYCQGSSGEQITVYPSPPAFPDPSGGVTVGASVKLCHIASGLCSSAVTVQQYVAPSPTR
jgi:prepilin-type N-terminal cleavage/methylation domain-containing protein